MPTTFAVPDGRTAMAATLWTGTQAARTIDNSVNGVSFQPDLIWTKSRSAVESHRLSDSVRGGNGTVLYELNSNETAAEGTDTDVSGFATNGFTIRAGSNSPNVTGRTYVGWQWKANGTAVTNTAGSITSSVSANTTAGFSIATYTGNAVDGATVGHGLGVAPKMVITGGRNPGNNWRVFHASLPASNNLYLNAVNAQDNITSTAGGGIGTSPTSTTFSLVTGAGGNPNNVNGNGYTFVAYCFAEIAGYSKLGSYTGNGSTDGPFVYTGFRPRFILLKCSSNSTSSTVWTIFDTSRSPYNASVNELYPNSSAAEGVDSNGIDILSNGFKPRRNSEYANLSGWTYIYYAVAENPFAYANAR